MPNAESYYLGKYQCRVIWLVFYGFFFGYAHDIYVRTLPRPFRMVTRDCPVFPVWGAESRARGEGELDKIPVQLIVPVRCDERVHVSISKNFLVFIPIVRTQFHVPENPHGTVRDD